MKKRDKTITRTIPALFPEKQVAQKVLSPEATQSQMGDLPMPARAAALSKHDVLWMLQETEGNPETSMSFTPLPTPTTERKSQQQDLAEELINRAIPR